MTKLSTGLVLAAVFSSNEYLTNVADKMATDVCEQGEHGVRTGVADKTSKKYLSLFKDTINPKLWKREEKTRLEVDEFPGNADGPFSNIEYWDNGEIDENLKQKALQDWLNSGKNKKYLPIQRVFVFSKYMSGDYSLDVWTTYDDTQIIGWAIKSD